MKDPRTLDELVAEWRQQAAREQRAETEARLKAAQGNRAQRRAVAAKRRKG